MWLLSRLTHVVPLPLRKKAAAALLTMSTTVIMLSSNNLMMGELDDGNSKFITQDAEIHILQDPLQKCQETAWDPPRDFPA